MSKTYRQLGTALFSNIVTQPSYGGTPTGKYELTITLSPEQAADAEANGLSITRSDYNGTEQVKAKFKTKYKPATNTVVDRKAKPFVDSEGNLREIPRGSQVAVFFQSKPYTMMGKAGVTNYLQGIQVIEENSSLDFETYEDDEVPFDTDDTEY